MPDLTHTYRCLCGAGMHISPFMAGRLSHCPRCRDFVVVPIECGDEATKPDFSITTSRMSLELIRKSDLGEFNKLYSDARNFNFEVSEPHTMKESKAALRKALYPRGLKKNNWLQYIARSRTDGRLIASLGLQFYIPYHAVTLGIHVMYKEQQQGFGTEAMVAVCGFLQDKIRVERIAAYCDSENRACRTMFEKAGFELEGISKKAFYHEKRGWVDMPLYALVREGD